MCTDSKTVPATKQLLSYTFINEISLFNAIQYNCKSILNTNNSFIKVAKLEQTEKSNS